ncbi:MAG TPA: hypothetical protein VJZ49_05700 [Syntrophales bacterium]|nr:hypothetical protein [Syntrophales bacterium]
MWAVGVVMMVVLCFGGLVGGGFSMHKHGVKKDAQVQTTKDAQRQGHEHGDAAGMSGDENKGTHQHMMQMEQQDVHGNGAPAEVSGDEKGIAKESEIEVKK